MTTLPISVVVPLSKHRKDFFYRYVLPSIESNAPAEILIEECEGTAPVKRNLGASKATQDYLFFCDDDTILGADCLKKMYYSIDEEVEGFAYSHFMAVVKDGSTHPHKENFVHQSLPFNVERLKKHNYIDTMSLLKKEYFPGFDEELAGYQDWDLWLRVVDKGVLGMLVDDVLYIKFYLDEGISSNAERHMAAKSVVKAKHGLL